MRAGSAAAGGVSNLFTPKVVAQLPPSVREVVVGAYSDALTPVFLVLVPIMLAAAALLVFITAKPLATTLTDNQPTDGHA